MCLSLQPCNLTLRPLQRSLLMSGALPTRRGAPPTPGIMDDVLMDGVWEAGHSDSSTIIFDGDANNLHAVCVFLFFTSSGHPDRWNPDSGHTPRGQQGHSMNGATTRNAGSRRAHNQPPLCR